ncbi:SPOR domain-containing protein [Thermomonas paludicola]|uniref:SPOR domain-containing protein n=1 Tax=Thermomonas paludicola TaxID=2884874 RepID=UPI002114CCF5|nr:SPOR domain-containing protein [Thermomonas paludicola]
MDASLKQRLVGAAVLVALAVIFLPLLVKGPAPDSGVTGVSMTVPAEPTSSSGLVSQDLPLVVPAAAPAAGVTALPTDAAAAADAPAAPAPAELAAVAAGGYAVGFGSYASDVDADKVIAALRGVGLPGYREAVALGGRQVQRVRIGPFADRAVAESARLRAGQVPSTVEAKVIALDAALPADAKAPAAAAMAAPDASKPAPAAAAKPEAKPEAKPAAKVATNVEAKPAAAAAPAAPPKPAVPAAPAQPPAAKPANPVGTGFVVQIGAFASAPDALAQRDALRKAGFNAFTDTVPGANGTLTRVRVGPVITRAEAEALQAQLKSKAGKDGMVRPHP